MREHSAQYLDFFVGDEFEGYIARMASPRCWGDELTLQTVADAFCIKIHLITSTNENWYLHYEPEDSSATVVRECFMSYISPIHYNTMAPTLAALPTAEPKGLIVRGESLFAEREVEEVVSQQTQHSAPPPPLPVVLPALLRRADYDTSMSARLNRQITPLQFCAATIPALAVFKRKAAAAREYVSTHHQRTITAAQQGAVLSAALAFASGPPARDTEMKAGACS
jgi:hypothetical protein